MGSPFSSESKSSQSQTTATDEAFLISGKKASGATDQAQVATGGGTITNPNSFVIGNKGKLVSPGSYDFSGVKGNVTLTTDSGAADSLAEKFLTYLSAKDTPSQAITATANAQTPETSTEDGTETDAAKEPLTDDAKQKWIAGLSIAAALLSIWWFFFRK